MEAGRAVFPAPALRPGRIVVTVAPLVLPPRRAVAAEVVIFPEVYERDGAPLSEAGALCVTGTVEDQMGACRLHAEVIGWACPPQFRPRIRRATDRGEATPLGLVSEPIKRMILANREDHPHAQP